MANTYMKRCLTSPVIWEKMQIKTAMKSHFIPVRMDIIQNKSKNKTQTNQKPKDTCWES